MPRSANPSRRSSSRKVRVPATQPAKVRSKAVDGDGPPERPDRTLWRARYSSRNFDFEAFGETKTGAEAALRLGLKHHANQTGIEWGWEGDDEFQFDEIKVGAAYRDNERLK